MHDARGAKRASLSDVSWPQPYSFQSLAWPVAAVIIAFIFRRPIEGLLGQISELKAGPVTVKMGLPQAEREAIERAVDELIASEPAEDGLVDAKKLVIRDSEGRARIVAATIPSGEPFLSLVDEDGQTRAFLFAARNADSDGVSMLSFRGKGENADMAGYIGAGHDGTSQVGVRDRNGWKVWPGN